MIKVNVTKQARYPISTPKIKKELVKFFEENGIVSDSEVSVAIVNEKRSTELAKRYLGEHNKAHNVLSFTAAETKKKFINPPDSPIHLGEVVVCYPIAVAEAEVENILVEEKVLQLIKHGALHLLGIHHK